jgi:putative glutamine amidotransferase
VQWHPEYLFYLPSQLRLFRWLVEMAQVEKQN